MGSSRHIGFPRWVNNGATVFVVQLATAHCNGKPWFSENDPISRVMPKHMNTAHFEPLLSRSHPLSSVHLTCHRSLLDRVFLPPPARSQDAILVSLAPSKKATSQQLTIGSRGRTALNPDVIPKPLHPNQCPPLRPPMVMHQSLNQPTARTMHQTVHPMESKVGGSLEREDCWQYHPERGKEGPVIGANCRGGMGETASVGLHCRLLGGGQSFTSPGASGGGYNDMDCLVAFVGREICSDL